MYEKTWRKCPPQIIMALFVYLTGLKGAGDAGMDLQHTCNSKKVPKIKKFYAEVKSGKVSKQCTNNCY